jgi:hypothetical protein
MSLKSRVARIAEVLLPPERPQIRIILRGPDAPESEYEPGVRVIRVPLYGTETGTDGTTESTD